MTTLPNPLEADMQAAWQELCERCHWVRQLDPDQAVAIFDNGYTSGLKRGTELAKGIYRA